jgi:glutathione S-transferase
MMKLFYAPHTCALATHIALEKAHAEYTAMRIDFAADEQRQPHYLAVNPKGRVPALVTGETVLTETPAILAFIAQSFPRARLAPLHDGWPSRRCNRSIVYVLDAACRACPPHARIPMGRRPGGHRSDAAQGAGIGGVMLGPHRA